MRRILILLLGLAFCLPAAATTTVSGNVQDTALGLLTKSVFVRFEIRNCGNNRPRVIGVTDIVKPYYDFKPDSVTGNISGTIYSNDEIDCAGIHPTEYGVTYYLNNSPVGQTKTYTIHNGTFNLTSATPNTVAPAVTPIVPNYLLTNPLGDQTVAQPSGSNLYINNFKATRANNIRFADQFSGTDAGAKIAAAIADLPSTGGTCDARGLEGAQTSSTNFLSGVGSKPVTLLLGQTTLTTAPLTGAANLHIACAGKYDSTIKLANAANASLLTFDSVGKWELSDCILDGNRTNQSGTSHVINILNTSGSALKYQMSRLYVTQGHDDGIHIASGVGGGQMSDIVAYFNDGNGVSDASTDNGWTNLDSGQSGLSGIVVTGANIKIANAKSWFSGRITPASGFGYDIRGSRNICSGCEGQDNQAHGFKATGNNQILVGLSANSNSQASSGTYDGIFLVDLTSSYITGNADAFADLNTYQGYGVNFTGTTTNNYVSLTTKGNVTAPVGGTPEGNNVTVVDGSGATTAYVMGSNVRFGSGAAQTGIIGLPNNKAIGGRNILGLGDIPLIKARTDDGVEIGNGYLTLFSTAVTPGTTGVRTLGASGTRWTTIYGTTLDLTNATIDTTGLGTFIGVKSSGPFSPTVAAAQTAGTTALPFGSLIIGPAANTTLQIECTACTANRVAEAVGDLAAGNISLDSRASDATVDLASVATGACTAERTVAVTGAAFGDSVDVNAGTALEAGTQLYGKVTSAGNIKWQFCNLSGGAIDRASDTYSIRVRK